MGVAGRVVFGVSMELEVLGETWAVRERAQLARRPLSTRTHTLKSGRPLIPHPPPPLAETEQPLFPDNTFFLTLPFPPSLHCSVCFAWIVQAIAPASPNLTLFSACVPDCRDYVPLPGAACPLPSHDAYTMHMRSQRQGVQYLVPPLS